MDGFREISAIDVRDETERQGALAVMLKRLVGHYRPEVGAPDTDIDDVANALTGMALPFAAPNPFGKVSHFVEHSVDLGHHVLAVHDDRRLSRRPQSDVQDGSIFRDVDLLAPEHGVDPGSQVAFFRQLPEEFEGFVRDAILRIIEVETNRLDRHVFAAFWIIREEVPEM